MFQLFYFRFAPGENLKRNNGKNRIERFQKFVAGQTCPEFTCYVKLKKKNKRFRARNDHCYSIRLLTHSLQVTIISLKFIGVLKVFLSPKKKKNSLPL